MFLFEVGATVRLLPSRDYDDTVFDFTLFKLADTDTNTVTDTSGSWMIFVGLPAFVGASPVVNQNSHQLLFMHDHCLYLLLFSG